MISPNQLLPLSINYLKTLTVKYPDRSVGSEGNLEATRFFRDKLTSFDWKAEIQEFDAIDWKDGGATLNVDGTIFNVQVSPYSTACSVTAPLTGVSNMNELETGNLRDKIIFLHGEIAEEQLMPKNFVFYNPESHQKIISLLENSGAKALICATGRNAALAGGVYPFPLIEDGDFNIPSVYMTEEEGQSLLKYMGQEAILHSVSERIPSAGYNVSGKKGKDGAERIVVTAHIDSKKGSPGAIDNATGVVILLLLAEMLTDYSGGKQIELVAFNGEDYFSVPGQMAYIKANHNQFSNILLNINIDGAGYKEEGSFFSYFDLPDEIRTKCNDTLKKHPELLEGPQWPQGDHSIFIQSGIPAIAVSSQWFIENIDSQDITHTPKDNIDIVDCSKLVDIAFVLNELIRNV